VAVTPGGSKVYVANVGEYNHGDYFDNVRVISTFSNTVTATIPVGRTPRGVAVSPDGSKVYVTNNADENVSVIDTAGTTTVTAIPVGSGYSLGSFIQ
jgi:YVTN family beta-propeller protein